MRCKLPDSGRCFRSYCDFPSRTPCGDSDGTSGRSFIALSAAQNKTGVCLMRPLLVGSNLSFSYGHRRILASVNISVNKGETVALIGANGAGKTTLLKICAGLLSPDNGEIRFHDRPLPDYTRRDVAQ